MSKVQKLRAVVDQRLTAAVEEIFGLFERTIAEYEEDAANLREMIDRQRKLLDSVLHREALLPDLQQLLVIEGQVLAEQQEWSPSLDQEAPELPHIKEEQAEPWISQELERLQGLEEAITKFPFTAVSVKSEDEEEKAQSSQLHQSQTEEKREAEPLACSSTEQITEADGEDCGVSEQNRNLHPASHLQPISDDETLDYSEPETKDSDEEWMEASEPHSGLDSQINSNVLVKNRLKRGFSYCSVCGKVFANKYLKTHMIVHTGEKQINCPVCGKGFGRKRYLKTHMVVHTGDKQFNCSVCGKGFGFKPNLTRHMVTHTGEKQCHCSVCGKGFGHTTLLKTHMVVHTGAKQFNCSVCGKGFGFKPNLRRHMTIHTR